MNAKIKKPARPRRFRGEGSFYQCHTSQCPPVDKKTSLRPEHKCKGIYRGVVDLGIRNGERDRKTVSDKNEKIARAKFVKLKEEIAKGGGLTANISVEEWLNHWLETIATERVRDRTLQGYRSYVNIWLVPYLGKYRLDKLKEDHVRALYRVMKEQGKSEATRRQAHAILRRSLVVAMREARIQRNPAANIDAPKVPKNNRLPLDLEQVKQIMAALDGDPLAARWVAALLLGLRQGEALGLKWEDVNMESKEIRIRRELLRITGKGLIETPPKSANSIRTIPIGGLMEYALTKTDHRGDYVFYGSAMNPRKDWQNWKELLVRSGVCPVGMAFGDMPDLASARTTTATLLRDAGEDGTVVRDMLGHSQVQVTQESYQRSNKITLKNAAKALEFLVTPEEDQHKGEI